MTDDLEFLKQEVSRLRVEQLMAISPLERLSLEKEIDEAMSIINAYEAAENVKLGVGSSEIDPVINSTPEPATSKPKDKYDWHNKPLGKIAIGVVIVVLGAICLTIISHYSGIQL